MTRKLLPSGLVALINALYHKVEPDDATLAKCWDDVAQLESWFLMETGFWISAEERQEFAQVREHLDGLAAALQELRWPPLHRHLESADTLMSRINQRRSKNPYSPLPALHHCILAGGAVIIGQGQWDCMPGRWQLVEGYVDNLDIAFDSLIAELDDERHDAIQVGFEKVRAAIDLGKLAVRLEDGEDLRLALQRLKDAGEILEFLPRWQQQRLRQAAQEHTRFNIPLIGARLEHDLAAMQRLPREQWSDAAKTRLNESLPALQEYLALEGPGAVMPPEYQVLWEDIDELLGDLRQAYHDVLDRKVSDAEARRQLEEVLDDLSAAFTDIDRVRLKPDALSSELAQTCASSAQGILRGQLPDPALLPLLEELDRLPSWREVAEGFRAYLADGDRDALHRAALAGARAAQVVASGDTSVSFVAE